MRQMGPMIQQMQQTCPECKGEGEVIKEKDRCKTCVGKKVISERKVKKIGDGKRRKVGGRVSKHS